MRSVAIFSCQGLIILTRRWVEDPYPSWPGHTSTLKTGALWSFLLCEWVPWWVPQAPLEGSHRVEWPCLPCWLVLWDPPQPCSCSSSWLFFPPHLQVYLKPLIFRRSSLAMVFFLNTNWVNGGYATLLTVQSSVMRMLSAKDKEITQGWL